MDNTYIHRFTSDEAPQEQDLERMVVGVVPTMEEGAVDGGGGVIIGRLKNQNSSQDIEKVDAGTQDYSNYFPNSMGLSTSKFDLVPRFDTELIQKRNESLLQQALNTRIL